jgi:predicted RNA binding protein YcfA (HicA-like mRNA interferase family)
VSGTELVRALERAGYGRGRQRGSHVALRAPDGQMAIVPLHHPLKKGTLADILDRAGWSADDLKRWLGRR